MKYTIEIKTEEGNPLSGNLGKSIISVLGSIKYIEYAEIVREEE